MTINPIIPIPVMAFICIILLALKRKGVFAYVIQVLIIVLIFVINLRIMIHTYDVPQKEYPIDILFVIDNTISMVAEDYDGENPRMNGVCADCNHIMEQFPGARFSVITFANEARRMIPYTSDVSTVNQMISTLHGQTKYYAKGTTFKDVVNTMKKTLDVEDNHAKIVFFISDGEVTNNGKLASFEELSDYIDGGAVLGYGTEDGGYMKAYGYSGDDEEEYIEYTDKDYNYVKAKSYIDETNLKKIATDLDVSYIHMTKTDRIDKVLSSLKDISVTSSEVVKTEGYIDIYFWFVIPLLVLFVVDLIYCKKRLDV